MSWTVTIEGGCVVFSNNAASWTRGDIVKPLGYCAASSDGDSIIIANAGGQGEEIFRADYTDFSSPTGASAAALRSTLNTYYLPGNSGGIGSAQPVELQGPASAFGEISTAENYPILQGDFVYDSSPRIFEEFTATGGSITVTDGVAICATGVSIGGYGLIRTKIPLVYRPGQGALARFTAAFSAGVALGAQRAGMISAENELSIGYDGDTFGILRRTNGALEIQTLTLSVAASGAETATVRLDGVNFTPALTGAGTVQADAAELAAASYTGWTAHQLDDTVIFVASATGAKGVDFSYSSTGTSAGTFAETRSGRAPSDTWVYQSDWNIDKADGSGPSGMNLDFSNLNIFEIKYQYLGAGAIIFSIENPDTGRLQPVHIIQYAGTSTAVHVRNPSFKIGWFAASLGSTSNLTTRGASCAGFIQGPDNPHGPIWAAQNSKTSIGNTATSILTLKIAPEFQGILVETKSEFFEVEASAALSGNNTGAILIYENATLDGTQNYQKVDNDSFTWIDTAGTTVTAGTLIATLPVGKNDSVKIDLRRFGIELARAEEITVAALANGGSGEFEASIIWREQI